jgi:hypothetical protein
VGIKIGLAGSAPIRVARVGPENLRSRLLDDLAFVEQHEPRLRFARDLNGAALASAQLGTTGVRWKRSSTSSSDLRLKAY